MPPCSPGRSAALKRTDGSFTLWQKHHASHTKKYTQEASLDRHEKLYEFFDLTDNDNICEGSTANLGIRYAKNRRKASEEILTYLNMNEACKVS